jgi:hypothetical protein
VIRVSHDGVTGVCRKSWDRIPAKSEVKAAVDDAFAQVNIKPADRKPKK